jgi:hypothetical protein
MPWILPSSAAQPSKYQPPSSTSLPPTLLNVLDSITFMISQTKSFFGSLDKHQALERIKEQAMKEGRQDVLDEVEVVEQHWNAGPSTTPNPAGLDNPSGVNSDLPIPLHPVRKVSP